MFPDYRGRAHVQSIVSSAPRVRPDRYLAQVCLKSCSPRGVQDRDILDFWCVPSAQWQELRKATCQAQNCAERLRVHRRLMVNAHDKVYERAARAIATSWSKARQKGQNRRSGAWQREWAISGRPGVSSMAKNTARWPRGHCIAQASTCDTAVASTCTAASAAKSPSAPPSRISRWSVTAASERERSRAATSTTHCEAQEPATTVREHANGPRAAANENSDLH